MPPAVTPAALPADLLPIREAATMVDRSLSTLRAWCRAGTLPSYRAPGGDPVNAPVLVSRAELVALVVGTGKQASPGRAPPASPSPSPGAPAVEDAAVPVLRAELAAVRVDLTACRAELAVARAELAGAVAVADALRLAVTVASDRAKDCADTARTERERAGAAEAERDALREAMREAAGLPWWRRLLSGPRALPDGGPLVS